MHELLETQECHGNLLQFLNLKKSYEQIRICKVILSFLYKKPKKWLKTINTCKGESINGIN